MLTKIQFPELEQAVLAAKLRVLGYQEVNDQAHARCMAALLKAYGESERGFMYAEPLLPSSDLSPDLVLAHPSLGILVVEVKAYEVGYIQGIEAGNLKIKRNGQETLVNPLRQAQKSMYAIKQAFEQLTLPDLRLLFNALVALPNINEKTWLQTGYEECIPRRLILFADDLKDPERLKTRLAKHIHQTLSLSGIVDPFPDAAEDALFRVFGKSAALGKALRNPRQLPFENLGAEIDRLESATRQLSAEQQELIRVDTWGHPYLLRGVAGSGKSIVMAYQVAQTIIRHERKLMQLPLFDEDRPVMPKIAALSLHRTLVPLLRNNIEAAYQNLTGHTLQPERVIVSHLNGILFDLAEQHPHFHYIPLTQNSDTGERSRQFLAQLDVMSPTALDELRFDAIFIDEGQDLHPDTLALLHTLVRPHVQTQERTLSIYYDDAQNIYGHQRPTWRTFGLNVEGGRAAFMRECYRNSREIVELSLNVLLGTAADEKTRVQTRRFADIYTLNEKNLVEETPDGWRVGFAQPSEVIPQVEVFTQRSDQVDWVAEVILNLVEAEQVRPEDILILTNTTATMPHLERKLRALSEGRLEPRLVGGKNRATLDESLLLPQQLTISTIAASKGYDAPLVILMDIDQLPMTVIGRALFYVGATRAKRYLVLTGVKTRESLLSEAHTMHKRLFPS